MDHMNTPTPEDVERQRNFAKVLMNLGIATREELWPHAAPGKSAPPPPAPAPAAPPPAAAISAVPSSSAATDLPKPSAPPPVVFPHDNKMSYSDREPDAVLTETQQYVADIKTALGFAWLRNKEAKAPVEKVPLRASVFLGVYFFFSSKGA